jgi:hypothetical protein
MASKAAHERQVFEEFAAVAGLSVARGSVASQPEPSPDIAWLISGDPYTFEPGRVADQSSVERVVESIRRLLRGDPGPTGGASFFHEPLVRIVRQKTSKAYQTGGVPVDLLVYYDNEIPTFEVPPPGDFKDWADMCLVPEVTANVGPWDMLDRSGSPWVLRIPAAITKSRTGRMLGLEGEVRAIVERRLKERRFDTPLIFHRVCKGKPGQPIADFWDV